MARSSTTGIYTRIDNSFSNPVVGTTISPSDADTYFDDIDGAMNAFIGTSTTSLAIGTGTKTFTTQASKSFLVGIFVQAFSQANHANYMYGTVTSYNASTGELVLDVTVTGGSGTLNDWLLFTSGARGPQGEQGPQGDQGPAGVDGEMAGPGASVDGEVALFSGTGGATLKRATGSGIPKLTSGVQSIATAGTDYVKPDTATAFTAQQSSSLASLADAANIDWDVSTRQKAYVTLGGNRTMNAVTGAVAGTTYWLWVLQDGTGSRTITWTTSGAGSFDFGADGAPTLTTTASRADLLCFEAITLGGTLKLRFVGIKRGFA